MYDKTLYDFERQDLSGYKPIERQALRKASELNDKFIDLKTLLEDISFDWQEFVDFLESERISKYCEFKGQECIDFDDELLNAIVKTLRESLINTNKAIDYNSKKIKINRAIDG